MILASSKIGAVHFMVFTEFSAQSLKDRFAGVQSALHVTANENQKGKGHGTENISEATIADLPFLTTSYVDVAHGEDCSQSVRGTAMTPSRTLTGSLATPTSSADPLRTDVSRSCSSRCPRENPGRYWDNRGVCTCMCIWPASNCHS